VIIVFELKQNLEESNVNVQTLKDKTPLNIKKALNMNREHFIIIKTYLYLIYNLVISKELQNSSSVTAKASSLISPTIFPGAKARIYFNTSWGNENVLSSHPTSFL